MGAFWGRGGAQRQVLGLLNFYLYSYEPKHFMTQDGNPIPVENESHPYTPSGSRSSTSARSK
jgi:hypothetical protein